jgi:hypothetical protein
MTEILKWASEGEAKVARALVAEILSRNLKIAVKDGEAWTTKITNDEQIIMKALCSTGEDLVYVFEGEKNLYCGSFWLVYGNADDGLELLADWSDNELTNEIVSAIGYMEV